MSAETLRSVGEREEAVDLQQAETLTQAGRLFLGETGPKLMVLAAIVAACVRIYFAAFGWLDLGVMAAIVLFWWFQEWFAHVTLLHMKPRTILGVAIDPIYARFHRAHHREPWSAAWVFVPVRFVILGFFVSGAAFWLLFPSLQLAATAWLAYCVMGVLYEWSHLLVHTRYKPRSRFFREVWKNHRLHHFKNEGYWFGLSGTLMDHVMQTAPDAGEVPNSDTTRNLGVYDEEMP